MDLRSSCLGLSLLASLGASGASPLLAESAPPMGTAGLIMSSPSSFPIDPKDVPVCKGGGSSILAQCVAVVRPTPLGRIAIQDGLASPIQLNFVSSRPLSTSCGLWDFTLTLDPARQQPASPLVFEEVPDHPGRGLFSGTVEMYTILHLVNQETGQTADFPLSLALDLAGPWTLTPAETGEPQLLLLADHIGGEVVTFEGCFPVQASTDPRHGEERLQCRTCLEPDITFGDFP